MEDRNIKKYYLRYFLYYFGNTLITGGILQSFMLECGMSSVQVSVYTAVIQFVQAIAMLLLGPVVEKRKNIISLNAEAAFGLLPVFLAMLVLCFGQSMPVSVKYALMLISGVIGYIAFAVIAILEYKLPYRLIHMENYGVVLSIAGAVIGITSMFCSTLFTWFINRFDYFKVMTGFLLVAVLFELLAIKVGKSYEDLKAAEEGTEPAGPGGSAEPESIAGSAAGTSNAGRTAGTSEEKSPGAVANTSEVTGIIKNKYRELFAIFSYEPFRKLFIPNLLRGIASGTYVLLTTIGYYYAMIDASAAAVMTVIANAFTMLGCLIYARLSKKKIDGPLTLASALMLLVLLPGMMIGKNTVVFIAVYALVSLFKTFIDYTCPVICTEIVDYEHVGQFSSWRIALYMLGAALAGLITVPMLDLLGGTVTLLINGIIFVIVGAGYYAVANHKTK